MRLDPEERDFLERVRYGKQLGLADRRQDRVRQRCRKWNLVQVEMKPRRWVITDLGRAVLDRPTTPNARDE